MGFSVSFDKLKNVVAAATVLATISCLAPESAEAGILKFSGSPNDQVSFIKFNLDDEATKLEITEEMFIFKEAVQDAKYICTDGFEYKCAGKNKINFLPADLKVYHITSSSDINKNKELTNRDITSFINGIKYEIEFKDKENNFMKLFLFVDPGEAEYEIDNLSNLRSLSKFTTLALVTEEVNSMGFTDFPLETVPDPNATNSLLGIGALGTVLLIKRTRRSIKFKESQNSALETQKVA